MIIKRNLNENYKNTNVTNEQVKRIAIQFVNEHGFDKNVIVDRPTRNNGIGWYPSLEHSSRTVSELDYLFGRLTRGDRRRISIWSETGYRDDSEYDINTHMCGEDDYRMLDDEVHRVDPNQTINPGWYTRCLSSWDKTTDLNDKDLYNICSLINYINKQHEHENRVRQREMERQRREQEHNQYVNSDQNSFAGDIGDVVSFSVATVKEIYGEYGIIYQLTGTDGRHYTVASTKLDSVDVGDTITGKIKSLSEFRGVKETRLRFISQTKAN